MPRNDYYGDPSEPKDSAPAQDPENRDDANQPTALIPKSLLAGKDFKVGDEIVLKIVALHEEDAEVEYAPEKPDKEEQASEPPPQAPPPMQGPGGGMDSYMS